MGLFGGPTRRVDDLFSDDIMEAILGISEGPIKGLVAGAASIYLNDTPLLEADGNPILYQGPLSGDNPSNYFDQPGVGEFDIREYLGNTPAEFIYPNLGFGSAVAVQVPLEPYIPVIRGGTQTEIDCLGIRIEIEALYYTDDDGSSYNNEAKILIQIRPQGGSDGDWYNPYAAVPAYPAWFEAAVAAGTYNNFPPSDQLYASPTNQLALQNSFSTFREVYVQAAQPTTVLGHQYLGYNNIPLGPIWFDSSNQFYPALWDGEAWQPSGATYHTDAPDGIPYWLWSEANGEVISYAFVSNPPHVPLTARDATHIWIVPDEITDGNIGFASGAAFIYNGVNWVDSLTWYGAAGAYGATYGAHGTMNTQTGSGIGSQSPSDFIDIIGHTTQPYVKEVRIPVPRIAVPYEVYVESQSAQNDNYLTCTMAFSDFEEIRMDPMQFNGLAAMHVTVRATDQFSSVPKITFDMLGVIVPVPSNYDPINRTYTGIWDGTWVYAWTDNPAFHINNLVQNSRYGVNAYAQTILNPMDVYRAAQYCDKYGFTFNFYMTEKQPIRDAINMIAGLFSGIWVDYGNGYSRLLFDDYEATEVATFGPENVIDGIFNYVFTDITSQVNDITVQYVEPEYNWAQSSRRLPNVTTDEVHAARFGRNREDFIAVGCIYSVEAYRRALLRLLKSTTERAMVTFKTNRLGVMLDAYDLISIADPDNGFGISGRFRKILNPYKVLLRDPLALPLAGSNGYVAFYVLTINVPNPAGGTMQWQTQIVLDQIESFNDLSGLQDSFYTLLLRNPLPATATDTEFFTISNEYGIYTLANGSVAYYQTPPQGSLGDGSSGLVNGGTTTGFTKTYKVLSIEPVENEPDNCTITAMEFNRTIGLQLLNLQVNDTLYTTGTPTTPLAPTGVTGVPILADDGSISIFVTWTPSISQGVSQYQITYWAVVNGQKVLQTAKTQGSGFTITAAMIAAVNAGGPAKPIINLQVKSVIGTSGSMSLPAGSLVDLSGYRAAVPDVTGLAINDVIDAALGLYLVYNPPIDTSPLEWQEFRSASPTIVWNAPNAPGAFTYELDFIAPDSNGSFNNGTVVATHTTSATSFVYTNQQNLIDFYPTLSSQQRLFAVRVYAIGADGGKSNGVLIVCVNPPPFPETVSGNRDGTNLLVQYMLPTQPPIDPTGGSLQQALQNAEDEAVADAEAANPALGLTIGADLRSPVNYDTTFKQAQIYVSDTSGFTPSSTTLLATSTGSAGTFTTVQAGLNPQAPTSVGISNTVIIPNRFPAAFGNAYEFLICGDHGNVFTTQGNGAPWNLSFQMTAANTTSTLTDDLGVVHPIGEHTFPANGNGTQVRLFWSAQSIPIAGTGTFQTGDLLFVYNGGGALLLRQNNAWTLIGAPSTGYLSFTVTNANRNAYYSKYSEIAEVLTQYVVVGFVDTFNDGTITFCPQITVAA